MGAGADTAYLWLGEGANEAEAKLGRGLFTRLFEGLHSAETKEGEEPESFWASFVGGRTDYSSVKDTGVPSGFEPRLFHASNSQGYFHVEEVPHFTQDDMLNDDIMLLDAYQTIYVWIGNQSNRFEKNGAYKTATRYIGSVRDERDKEAVQVVEIEAGKEPPAFTVNFADWDLDKAAKWLALATPQQEEAKRSEKPKPATGAPVQRQPTFPKKEAVSQDEVKRKEEERQNKYLDPESKKFDYAELNGKFPEGVDPTRKEAYLTEAQFLEVLGVTPAAFAELKQWKRNDLKKAKGLF